MTHFEYDLAFRAVIGLAGCAMALVAVIADWRETEWDYRALHWRELADAAIKDEVASNPDFTYWTTKGPTA